MSTSASPRDSFRLIGRERELGVLREHLDAALTERGSLVLIGGEAGVGKTALGEALCREAAERGALIVVGRCFDLAETPAYGPWLYLFERYRPDDTLPGFPLAFAERGIVGAVPSQAALFRQVQDFFEALTNVRPVVLLLDDLHWADPASLDLLRAFGQSATALSILVLVTYRSDELDRHHPFSQLLPALEREARATRLNLRRLSPQAVRFLLTSRYPLSDADTDRVLAYLVGHAEGNVFFTLQLLQALEEEEVLHRVEDGWAVGDLDRVRLPMAVRQVIDGRLLRLDDRSQRRLAIAAVIGQEVPFALWATVVNTDETTLLDTVEQALAAHLVEATADGAGFRFVHALIREALYESILSLRRGAIHRQVGDALAAAGTPDPNAVAFHFQQANDERALPWLLNAADRAQHAYAWLTASDRLEGALALMPTQESAAERGWLLYRLAGLRFVADTVRGIALLDDALRAAEAAGDHALAACARYFRGNHRYWAGDPRQGLVEIEEAVAALDALTVAERARLDARMASGAYTEVQFQRPDLALHLVQVGRYSEAVRMAESLMPDAERAGGADRSGEMQYMSVYTALGEGYAALGRPAAAQQAFARARRAYAAAERYWNVGRLAYRELERVVLPYRADALTEREQLAAQAVAAWAQVGGTVPDVPPRGARVPLLYVEGGWEEARQIGNSLLVTRSLTTYQYGETMCRLLHARGEVEQAWALVHATVPEGPGTVPGGSLFPHSLAAFRLAATLLLDAGDLTAAKEWLDACDAWLEWAGAVAGRAEGAVLWARYSHRAGDAPQAYLCAQRALAHATEPRQPLALIAAHRLLGELHTDAGRFADAQTHLSASLALADACAAPFERALTLLALAECHRAAGDTAAAMTLIAEVRAICVPLAARPTLAKADALAERINMMVDPLPTYPAGLSAREVEVLRLIATGLTNREIAESLSISVKTVLNHVTHILTKTNLPNRAAAVAFALQHDLGPR